MFYNFAYADCMTDEEFFELLSNLYAFDVKQVKELKKGWPSLSPLVRNIMKTLYGSRFTSVMKDWKIVDDIIKNYEFSQKMERLIE